MPLRAGLVELFTVGHAADDPIARIQLPKPGRHGVALLVRCAFEAAHGMGPLENREVLKDEIEILLSENTHRRHVFTVIRQELTQLPVERFLAHE